MAVLAPPPAPPVVVRPEDDGQRRFRVRMVKIGATSITLLITAWLFKLDMLAGIFGLIVAKHILIAVFLLGSGIHDPRLIPPPKEP